MMGQILRWSRSVQFKSSESQNAEFSAKARSLSGSQTTVGLFVGDGEGVEEGGSGPPGVVEPLSSSPPELSPPSPPELPLPSAAEGLAVGPSVSVFVVTADVGDGVGCKEHRNGQSSVFSRPNVLDRSQKRAISSSPSMNLQKTLLGVGDVVGDVVAAQPTAAVKTRAARTGDGLTGWPISLELAQCMGGGGEGGRMAPTSAAAHRLSTPLQCVASWSDLTLWLRARRMTCTV
jgi:hypothetical protein